MQKSFMKIYRYSLGQLQANCYFLVVDEECLIIDPADDASFILEEVQRRKLKLVGMLATHGHFDHVMAAGEIQLSIETQMSAVETHSSASLQLWIKEKDLFLIDRLTESAKYFLGYSLNIMKPIAIKHLIAIEKKFSNFGIQVINTPGHTPGSVCFYIAKEKIIFTGDTLFKNGIGRYDFSYSNKADLKKSLVKLLKLPEETIVYSGHGESTTIGKEKDKIKIYNL